MPFNEILPKRGRKHELVTSPSSPTKTSPAGNTNADRAAATAKALVPASLPPAPNGTPPLMALPQPMVMAKMGARIPLPTQNAMLRRRNGGIVTTSADAMGKGGGTPGAESAATTRRTSGSDAPGGAKRANDDRPSSARASGRAPSRNTAITKGGDNQTHPAGGYGNTGTSGEQNVVEARTILDKASTSNTRNKGTAPGGNKDLYMESGDSASKGERPPHRGPSRNTAITKGGDTGQAVIDRAGGIQSDLMSGHRPGTGPFEARATRQPVATQNEILRNRRETRQGQGKAGNYADEKAGTNGPKLPADGHFSDQRDFDASKAKRTPTKDQPARFKDGGNWIADAIKRPGAFKAKATAAGESTASYAEKKKNAPGRTGRQARLAQTLAGLHR